MTTTNEAAPESPHYPEELEADPGASVVLTVAGTPAGDAVDGTYLLARVPGSCHGDSPTYAGIVCGFLVFSAALYGDGWSVAVGYPDRAAWPFRTKRRAGDANGGSVEGIDGGTATVTPMGELP